MSSCLKFHTSAFLFLNLAAQFDFTPCSIQGFFARFLVAAQSYIILLACFQLCEGERSFCQILRFYAFLKFLIRAYLNLIS